MKRSKIITKDGSATLHWPEYDEHYHSFHGALTESKHVFIDAGLEFQLKTLTKPIAILEMGFGTGLNALLTYQLAQKREVSVHYTTIEAFPLQKHELEQLNYDQLLGIEATVFQQIHSSKHNEELHFPYFTFQKQLCKLQDAKLESYHLIYYDAFAPSAQPELWEKSIFVKLYNSLQTNGCLVTYCAKGAVKRTLQEVGFFIEALPGPPGKREMTRAIKR